MAIFPRTKGHIGVTVVVTVPKILGQANPAGVWLQPSKQFGALSCSMTLVRRGLSLANPQTLRLVARASTRWWRFATTVRYCRDWFRRSARQPP